MSWWYSIQSTVFHDSFYWFQSLVYKVLHTRALVEEYQWHFDVANWQSCDNIRSARSAIRASDSLEQAGGAKRLIYGGSIAPFLPLVIQCIICADCTHITLDTIRMWSVLCQAKKIAWEQWRFSKMQNYTIVQRSQYMHLYRKRKKMSAPLFTLGCISPAAMRLQLLIYRVSRAIVTRCGVCNVYSSSDLAQNVIEGFWGAIVKGVNMFVQRAEANFGGLGQSSWECRKSRVLQ